MFLFHRFMRRFGKEVLVFTVFALMIGVMGFSDFPVAYGEPGESKTLAAADAKVEDALAAFYKDKTRPNAEAVFEAIKQSIEEKKTGGDYQAAIKLAIKGATVAKLIKGKEYDEFQTLKKQIIEERDLAALKAKLQKALDANPKNKLTRERLIRIALLNEDKPDQAAKYVDEHADESLRNIVTLAGKDSSELDEEQLLLMSEWYYRNGKSLPAAKKRTIAYLEAFLGKHEQRDAKYKQAQKLLSKLNAEGGRLGKNTFRIPARSDWVATIELQAGKKYYVDAPGVWFGGPANDNGNKANGDGGLSSKHRHTFYLEGKHPIPKSQDPTGFRTRKINAKGLFTATESGTLYLRMHDEGNRNDNCGELVVTVTETDMERIPKGD